eukprot:jgi/Psemu1/1395/gm1.1395_g
MPPIDTDDTFVQPIVAKVESLPVTFPGTIRVIKETENEDSDFYSTRIVFTAIQTVEAKMGGWRKDESCLMICGTKLPSCAISQIQQIELIPRDQVMDSNVKNTGKAPNTGTGNTGGVKNQQTQNNNQSSNKGSKPEVTSKFQGHNQKEMKGIILWGLALEDKDTKKTSITIGVGSCDKEPSTLKETLANKYSLSTNQYPQTTAWALLPPPKKSKGGKPPPQPCSTTTNVKEEESTAFITKRENLSSQQLLVVAAEDREDFGDTDFHPFFPVGELENDEFSCSDHNSIYSNDAHSSGTIDTWTYWEIHEDSKHVTLSEYNSTNVNPNTWIPNDTKSKYSFYKSHTSSTVDDDSYSTVSNNVVSDLIPHTAMDNDSCSTIPNDIVPHTRQYTYNLHDSPSTSNSTNKFPSSVPTLAQSAHPIPLTISTWDDPTLPYTTLRTTAILPHGPLNAHQSNVHSPNCRSVPAKSGPKFLEPESQLPICGFLPNNPRSGNTVFHLSKNVERLLAQTGGGVNPHWILLDSESSIDLIFNRTMVKNICTSNNRSARINQIANLPRFRVAWFYEQGIASILSLALVTDQFRVTMDSAINNAMYVHQIPGTCQDQQLQEHLCLLAENDLLCIIDNILLKNSSVTRRDVKIISNIYEQQTSVLKGKTHNQCKYGSNASSPGYPGEID